MLRLYIGILVPVSILFPLTAAIGRNPLLSRAAKSIVHYLAFSALINAVSILVARKGINNLPLLHLFTPLEFALLCRFYCLSLNLKRKTYLFFLIGFTLLSFLNSVLMQSIFSFNTYARSLEALFLLVFSLLLFYNLLISEQTAEWYHNPISWFNIGIFLYFSGSLFLFLLSQVLLQDKFFNETAWVIHATLVLIMYLFFTAAFFSYKKQRQSDIIRMNLKNNYPGIG